MASNAAMDVDKVSPNNLAKDRPKGPPANPLFPHKKVTWVAPPSSPEDLGSSWTSENSTQAKLVQFLARWPPSRTPEEYGPWISASRGGMKNVIPNLAGLESDFQALLSGDNVKPETLDQIAKTNNVLIGKWMVFEEPAKIDMLWGKIVHYMCMERQKGFAKVSTYKEDEKHVICIYVDDYTDREEVKSVRKALKTIGVKKKIGFKPDAYTHLNIYKENPWKIRPSRYLEYVHTTSSDLLKRERPQFDSSMFSFLNQALFGNDESDRNTTNDTGQQTPAWRDLANFYQEHEATLKKCESLDVLWAAKHDREAELEEAVEAFASSADVIAEGLVRLANVHPILGVAVSAYHSVLGLNLPSAVGHKHKKVLLVMLQMQSMMCTMFELRNVKYTIRTKSGSEKTHLQSVLIAIATDIMQCGHELNYFMSREVPFQLLLVNIFEKKVRQHIKVLVTRRNELQSILSDRSSLGITRSRTNTAITAIGHMLQQADPKLHNFVANFFKRIRTPDELEAVELLEGTKAAPPTGKVDAFVKVYANLILRFMDGPKILIYNVSTVRKIVYEALSSKWETVAFSLSRFKKLIEVLDRDSERGLLSRQQTIQRMSQQLQVAVSLPVVVKMNAMGGRIKSVDLGPFADMKDVEMTHFWNTMNFGPSVEIDIFESSYHRYLVKEASTSTLVAISSDDEWVSESIRIVNNASFSGSLYEPGSISISIAQAHRFALERPEGMSLASWLAYWSSGWRINIEAYRAQIFSVMRKMHEAFDSVHIANIGFVGTYLNSPFFIYIDGLFNFIGAGPVDNVNQLTEVARSIAEVQEERILANLSDVSFTLQSPAEVELIGGFGRIEAYILPLLYILLQRHLAVIEIAQRVPLADLEIFIHIQSLQNVFKVFYKRMDELAAKFKEAQQDLDTQFKDFAHGMFHSSFTLDPTKKTDISTSLSTFRIAHHPLSRSYTQSNKGKTIDLSILVKGRGKDVIYHDIDRSIMNGTNQRTHELEGGWFANSSLILGITRINIGPISNLKIEGTAESFVRAYKVTGCLEPSASSTAEKLEKPDGFLDVHLSCERLPTDAKARVLTFKGRYDPDKEVFRGHWGANGKTDDRGDGEVLYSRISAGDSRFAYFLRGGESRVDPSWTPARRRWAFVIEAVLSQVQVQMGSSRVMKRGLEERRNWLRTSVFEDNPSNKADDKTSVADQQLFDTLVSTVPAENGRLYQALAEYTHLRKVYDLGGAFCDSCNSTIKHSRFTCITCRSRFGKGNNVDLCAYCFESPKPMENCAYVHLGSHSLIRASTRIHHFDEYEMIRQARVLSEDVKKSFRGISGQDNVIQDQRSDDGITNSRTRPASLKCACCEKEITLPCYACLTCSLHPFFCIDCDSKEESIRKTHPSFAIHTRKHFLLRINDSTSVDTDLTYDT